MDHLSIIIINYNADKDTRDCLFSLEKIEVKDCQVNVIVVDNASQKPFVVPRTLPETKFEMIRSESNLGFTGGNNLGIKFALDKYNSDYVVLLNNDTYVDPQFLLALLEQSQAHPEQGMISPKIFFAKGREYHKSSYSPAQRGNILWYGGGSIDWLNLTAFHRGVDEVNRGQFYHQLTSDYATGCCIFIKRGVLERIGLFDERFFLYLEDVDLSVRASEAGYKIGFCDAAWVWHKNAGSSGGAGSSLHEYYQTRNRLYFGLKHGTFKSRLTTLHYLSRLLTSKNNSEKLAAWDLIQGNLGKRIAL